MKADHFTPTQALVCSSLFISISFFFFNDTSTAEIYTLSLHDALPIYVMLGTTHATNAVLERRHLRRVAVLRIGGPRSEEHTSELQSLTNLVCRLLLEKKKKRRNHHQSLNISDKLNQHDNQTPTRSSKA